MALTTRSRILLGLIPISLLAACSSSERATQYAHESTSESRQALFVDATAIWPGRTVPVCWENDGADFEKDLVRSAVEQVWATYSAISFSGWGRCPDQPFDGLRVRTADEWPHTKGLGTQLKSVRDGVVLNFWFNFTRTKPDGTVEKPFESCTSSETERRYCIRTISVHEFGHALGFAHEQNRPDTPETCNNRQGSDGTVVEGPWDPYSVMNYCNPSWNNNGFLSITDTQGLQTHYGRPVAFANVAATSRASAIVVNPDGIYARRSNGDTFLPNTRMTSDAYYGQLGTYFADATGDGLADAIVVNRDAITVRPSNELSFGPGTKWTSQPYWGNLLTAFADVDGDHKADAIVVNDDKIVVRRSTGSAFGAYESWTDGTFVGGQGTFFADVDGDGRADAIAVNDWGVQVRRSTGTKFGPPEYWTSNGYYGARGTFAADVTGDGKADLVVVNNDAVVVRRSTGSAFDPNERWTDNPYYGMRGTYFHDVTGDGRADAIVVNDDRVVVRRSTGTAFASNEVWIDEPFHGLR